MPKFESIEVLQKKLLKGNITCLEIVKYYISQIEEKKDLNAFVDVFENEAIHAAKKIDEKITNNSSLGKLFGVVISVKDNICIKGKEVTAASDILEGFESTFTATAIQRLIKEDAIVIGRTNCDEFAMGSANSNSKYGAAKNGLNPEYVPGGSSGGAAVSVQTDCCLIGIGSDTGGSVRQPAGFCGVIGFKPSYGRVSRYGLLAYASSFDQIGVLAHSVQDLALISEIMYGHDEMDATSSRKETPILTHLKKTNPSKKINRIAYLSGILDNEEIDVEIRNALANTIQDLSEQGHETKEVNLDILEYAIPAYYVLTTAEATSNLSRYDGIRFGYRNHEKNTLSDSYKKSRTEGFGKEVKRRIMTGNFVLSSGYYDAYFRKAQQVRRLISERLEAIFEDYDFILLPVSPTPPWRLDDKNLTPVQIYLSDIFTVLANLAGVPAISLPVGKHENNKLPIGVQFMSAKHKDEEILCFSHQFMCNK